MAMTRLSCDSIGDLDEGRARAIINAALAVLYRDIEDRGHDEKSRSIQITLTFQTNKGLVVTDVQAKAVVPPFRSNLTSAKMLGHRTANGVEPVLCFQEHDADNPDQSTFKTMDQDEKDEA